MIIGMVLAVMTLLRDRSDPGPITGGTLIGVALTGVAVGGVIGAVVGVTRETTRRKRDRAE